ncbi:MAG: endopeptidase La [Treponema sp.]|nr:endopeptidase La [Treponema sp.]
MKPRSKPRGFISELLAKAGGAEEHPLLPLRDLVIFPQTTLSVYITYKEGIHALEEALSRDLRLFAACQKPPAAQEGGAILQEKSSPKAPQALGPALQTYDTGTVVRIIQNLRLPDNTFRVVLQGEYRAQIISSYLKNETAMVTIDPIRSSSPSSRAKSDESPDPLSPDQDQTRQEISALVRAVQKSFAQYAEYTKKISTEILTAVEKNEGPERLVNIIANVLSVKPEKKIDLLRISEPRERLEKLLEIIEMENEIFGIQKNISGKVKSRMDKNQREYILNEQLREINKELGKKEGEDEFSELEGAIANRRPGEEILAKVRKEIGRLRKLQPFSPEAGVLRGYLEWITDLPWSEYSLDSSDLKEAELILDEDHYEMKKAKERIIEFIAVRQLCARTDLPLNEEELETVLQGEEVPEPSLGRLSIKGPILCFVGPPGTGKTSLGKSVARALGRKFIRISLGGVRDEAEIRGHRKTYVGALPGKIIQSMKKAGTMNPVFLLDEIDKLSHDFRGDPASALLEVLDPEQNSTFMDHYLEVPYDLSKVLFITTANSLHSIPYPLLDRMEIIEIPGYGENEKLAIAQKFLVPKELQENGLSRAKIVFKEDALRDIIRHWTSESGVRSLEREIARCIRRIAKEAVNKEYGKRGDKPIEAFSKTIRREGLEKLLGRRRYKNDVVFKEARIGVSYGLAYTETGGTMLPVETIRFEGNGENTITGNLGDVMKESARIALSYLRSVQDRYGFITDDVGKTDFHIHVPEGAIPKDGPSAGLTLAVSLLSTLCQAAPRGGVAMTGELTLTGRILPIGGLKEKLLAAIRNGMEEVLLPSDNKEDWEELGDDIKKALEPRFVEYADQAFALLFDPEDLNRAKQPTPKKKTPAKKAG